MLLMRYKAKTKTKDDIKLTARKDECKEIIIQICNEIYYVNKECTAL